MEEILVTGADQREECFDVAPFPQVVSYALLMSAFAVDGVPGEKATAVR